MKKFLSSVFLIYCLIFLLNISAFAGSGISNTVLKDTHSFKFFYGSTEIDNNYSLINYIDAEVSVPGLRGVGDIWASPLINPDTTQPSISSSINPTYQSFGAGFSSKTKRFRIYTPSSPNTRIRVRRGNNVISVKFTYQYIGILNSNNCANGMCGTATTFVVVR